ncbi:MAG: hypothetical protein IPH13_13500 [Planctomycetes bacterium]|nr:hypothetical protein [Planctomycetota bacterium]MCC7169997.1 hypothetical protein [Planctomycetota bacterium]
MLAPVLAVSAVELVLIALVLGGLVGVYLLLVRRLGAFEARAQELERTVDALLRAKAEPAPAAAPPPSEPPPVVVAPPVEVDLEPVLRQVRELGAQLDAFADETRRALAALAQQTRERSVPERPRVPTVREVVEQHYRERGYTLIRLLSAGDTPAMQPTRIGLEAARGGIWHKGYAIVDASRVVEDKLTSSHEVFP